MQFSLKSKRQYGLARLAFLLASLLLIYGQVAAQKENLATDALSIRNNSDHEIVFSLRNKYTNRWTDYAVLPKRTEIFYKQNHIQFVNRHGVITTERDLAFKTAYEVFWNDPKDWWDIRPE